MKKKLYNVTQQQGRFKKRIETLTNVLASLKKRNLLSDNEFDIIQNFSKCNADLLTRQLKKARKDPIPRLYSPELRRFALNVHYYSPHAYEYIRKKFDNCLPHSKTLHEWYYTVNGEPGLLTEAFKAIKQRVKSSAYQLVGALIIDEMAIAYDNTLILMAKKLMVT